MLKQIQRFFLGICLFVLLCGTGRADGILHTLLGIGPAQAGSAAIGANLAGLQGIASDPVGNLFIADTANNRILEVDGSSGLLSVVAGTGEARFGGDQGPGTAACLWAPLGLSFAGHFLFIADSGNNRVRMLDLSDGIIDTVAGDGNAGSLGVGGPPTLASVDSPTQVCANATGSGIWVLDKGPSGYHAQYFTVGPSANTIITVAGDGAANPDPSFGDSPAAGSALAAPLFSPSALALGPDGLYVAVAWRVRRISNPISAAASISSVAGAGINTAAASTYAGGPAASASLATVDGLAFDRAGDLFISDANAGRVLELAAGTQTLLSAAGDGSALVAGDGGPASAAGLGPPQALAMDGNGDLFLAVAGSSNPPYGGSVRRIAAADGLIRTVAGGFVPLTTTGPARQFEWSQAGALAPLTGGDFVFADGVQAWRYRWAQASVEPFAGDGASGVSGYEGDGGPALSAPLQGVTAVAVDAAGDVYLGDKAAVVRRVDPEGVIRTVAGAGPPSGNGPDDVPATSCALAQVDGLACAPGKLYLANNTFGLASIRVVDLASGLIGTVAGQGGTGYRDGSAATAQFGSEVDGLAWDPAGFLYVADPRNNAVRRVDLVALTVTTLCGLGPYAPGFLGDGYAAAGAALSGPTQVWLDGLHGLLIGDSGNNRVRRVDLDTGIIESVAGVGVAGYGADGGPALDSVLSAPGAVYAVAGGDFVFADAGNHRVCWVDFPKTPVPTPVSPGDSHPVAYPSPAGQRVCLSYWTRSAGPVSVEVFNMAMQLAARFDDSAPAAGAQLTCADVRGLSNGAYIYRIHPPEGAVMGGKFKVIH